MNTNIDTLLKESLPVIEDNGFSKQVLNTLISKQQNYLKLRQRIITLCIGFCSIIISVLFFLFNGHLLLTNTLNNLSVLLFDVHSVYIVSGIVLLVAYFVASETLEGS